MSAGKPRVGVLCFCLMPATTSLLNRLHGLGEFRIKAYPLVDREMPLSPSFEFRPARFKGRFFTFNNAKGDAPDKQLTALCRHTVNALVAESEAVMLMGLQSLPGMYAVWKAGRHKKPVIAVLQSMGPEAEKNRSKLVRLLKGWLIRRANQHVVQTPATVEMLEEVYGIERSRVIRAPFEAGVGYFRELYRCCDATRDGLRHALDAGDSVVFLNVGSHLPLKGLDVLISAFGLLVQHGVDAKLWLVGGGIASESLRKVKALYKHLEQKRTAITGPMIGPAPAMEAKWCAKTIGVGVGTKSRPSALSIAGAARPGCSPILRAMKRE